ncbi:hypothetical protein F4821DRAFT_261952 [Hypoxylon rubiginosum]|uniref:Uncharacterized protein n=1 Tax=Hypoxylon rubiginosum TaxID=110542 RepID=A0ACC0CVT8_9PEZI|nr:hypothetical protein F4821DRAFT_261952 [Hypoxylon rubiginosum]
MPPAMILLRLLPVMTTTSTLTLTFCEDLFLRPHTQLSGTARDHANGVLPPYIARWFPPGFAYILVFYPATWALAIANLAVRTASFDPYYYSQRSADATSRAAWSLYAAGLVFSLAHFAWGPKAKGLLDAVAANGPRAVAHSADRTNAGNTISDDSCTSSDEADGEIKDSMPILRDWLRLNAIRGISVDVPAWACFFIGFLLSATD